MTPGQKIVEEAFDHFARWEHKFSEQLEDIDLVDRPTVYSHYCAGNDINIAILLLRRENGKSVESGDRGQI